MAAPKLRGDQYPGLNEEQVREVVREEQVRLVEILSSEIADTPVRADGNINARDLHQTLGVVARKIRIVV